MTVQESVHHALAPRFADGKKPRCLVALSGGQDSVALLYALQKEAEKTDFFLHAVHVHHGIRGEEADRDAGFCEALCEDWDVPFHLCRVDVPAFAKAQGLSIEDAARKLRYQALQQKAEELGADCILTAHHQDDQAETVLLRLIRGTTVDGLCGIAQAHQSYLRPLLAVERSEIEDFCALHGLPYVEDSTNDDTAYLRNFVRHRVMPLLKSCNPRVTEAIVRLSQSAKEDADYWNAQLALMLSQSLDCTQLAPCHDALLKRYLAAQAYQNGAKNVTAKQLEAAVQLVRNGKTGQSVSFAPSRRLRRSYQTLIWEQDRAPSQDFAPTVLTKGKTELPNGDTVFYLTEEKELAQLQNIYKSLTSVAISSATIQGSLICRKRKEGDTVRQNRQTKSYKKLAQSRHADAKARDALPLVCDDAGVLWIPHLALCDRIKVKKGEKPTGYFAYLPSPPCNDIPPLQEKPENETKK